MTKEEVKEDFRQSEGDPHVKARQRQIRMERARRRMIQQVPKATVVVMNPTHYAVALRYEQGETPAPQCVAKGVDAVALKIREVAEEAGVPVIEDPPLARALYATVEVDQIIPHAALRGGGQDHRLHPRRQAPTAAARERFDALRFSPDSADEFAVAWRPEPWRTPDGRSRRASKAAKAGGRPRPGSRPVAAALFFLAAAARPPRRR